MKQRITTSQQAFRFLVLLGMIAVIVTIVSATLDLRGTEERYRQLATEVGRTFSQAINAMREWNFDQGGIYVRITKDAVPNPYLHDSLREVVTAEGMKLTLVNHTQMTRLLSELLNRQEGVKLHLMSLAPVRPENRPDPWEERALKQFERGSSEEYAIVKEGSARTFRYISPLRSAAACLPCHQVQNGIAPMILGGLSVAFPYSPFESAIANERIRILVVHAVFLGLGIGLITLTGRRLIHNIGALQDSLLTIRRLEGFLPICAKCKKIRAPGADHGRQESWVAIESYIEERTDAEFTHGLCPECRDELYPGLFKDHL